MRQVTQKIPPFTSQRYRREIVKCIPCVATGQPARDAHHIKGLKRGTAPKDDRLIIPLTREQHRLFHDDPKAWEARHGSQINHCLDVLNKAREFELLRVDLIDEAVEYLRSKT